MVPNPEKPKAPTVPARIVSLSNAVVRAGHSLTLAEKRLVMLAVSKLDSRIPPRGSMYHPVSRVTAEEYAETYGVEMNTAYESLQQSGLKLVNRRLSYSEDGRRKSWMNWVGRAEYHDGEGWIELHWWHELLPQLFMLRKHYTSYQLRQAAALRSVYSWRLMERLQQYADKEGAGKASFKLDEFCESLQAPPSCAKHYGSLKRRIIDPAVRELRDKDGWLIDWRPTRSGSRKVTGLRFVFERSKQQQFQLDGPG